MGIFEDARSEESLRLHIRHLLYDYAIEHLTTDYIEFTEQAVTELLSQSLRQVPLTESFSVRLPTEPFESLKRLYALDKLEKYEEPLLVSTEASEYLKRLFVGLKLGKRAKSKSEEAIYNNDYECYVPHVPFEPILSRRARNQTPRPGSNESRKTLPKTYHDLITSSAMPMKLTKVDPIEEPIVNSDQTLNVNLTLNSEMTKSVKQFFKSVAVVSCPPRGVANSNRYFDPSGVSTRPDSPPFVFLFDNARMEFGVDCVPIFSRRCRPASGSGSGNFYFSTHEGGSVKGPGTIPVPVARRSEPEYQIKMVEMDEGEDEVDLRRENMIVVNGWQTYCSSSPSRSKTTPSSSQEDQLLDHDQLRMPSSPDTEFEGVYVDVESLKEMRMDVPAIPRGRRIGGFGSGGNTKGKAKQLGADKSLAAFLLNSLQRRRTEPPLNPTTTTTPEPEPEPERDVAAPQTLHSRASLPPLAPSPSPEANESMVGQPPSVSERTPAWENHLNEGSDMDMDMGLEISRLYQAVRGEDPKGIIFKEKLDEKRSFVMEVPHLPPPTDHPPNDLFIPLKYSDFVVPSKNNTSLAKLSAHWQFLKKTKGLQPLNLELSWVPFTVQDRLPTTTEVIRVDRLVDRDDNKNGMSVEQIDDGVSEVLGRVLAMCGFASSSDSDSGDVDVGVDCEMMAEERVWRRWLEGDEDEDMLGRLIMGCGDCCGIILSGEERRRLVGLRAKDEEATVKGGHGAGNAFFVEGRSGGGGGGDMTQHGVAYDSDQERGYSRVDEYHIPRNFQGQGEIYTGYELQASMELEPEPEPEFYLLDSVGGQEAIDDVFRYQHPDSMGYPVTTTLLKDEDEGDSDKENWAPLPMPMATRTTVYDQDDQELGMERPYKRRRLGLDSRGLQGALGTGDSVDDSGISFFPDEGFPRRHAEEVKPGRTAGILEDFVYGGSQRLDEDLLDAYPAESNGGYRTAVHMRSMSIVDRDYQQTSFEPLCFDSQTTIAEEGYNAQETFKPVDASTVASDFQAVERPPSGPPAEPNSNSMPLLKPEIFNSTFGALEFARLRARKVRSPEPEPAQPEDTNISSIAKPDASITATATDDVVSPPRNAPQDLYDQRTLKIPPGRTFPTSTHCYLTSMDFLQKQMLVRSLRSSACAIGLVERDTLGGVDLIIDPHTAIIFTNLFGLPSQCENVLSNLCSQSQRYTQLLVIFEAYAPSMSFKSATTTTSAGAGAAKLGSSRQESKLFAYSPPVLKAVKKLRRDLSISEACDKKRKSCKILMAFADTVDEAAIFARCFGDMAEAQDETGGAIWGDRAWLEDECTEDEQSLAAADGMNHFAACVVLCQTDLDSFLELSAEERMRVFAPQIGSERMNKLNEVIDIRM